MDDADSSCHHNCGGKCCGRLSLQWGDMLGRRIHEFLSLRLWTDEATIAVSKVKLNGGGCEVHGELRNHCK